MQTAFTELISQLEDQFGDTLLQWNKKRTEVFRKNIEQFKCRNIRKVSFGEDLQEKSKVDAKGIVSKNKWSDLKEDFSLCLSKSPEATWP